MDANADAQGKHTLKLKYYIKLKIKKRVSYETSYYYTYKPLH